MATRVLVTGASGHIGSNVVHDLVAHGYEAVAFARATSDLRAIEPLGVEVRRGDVLDAKSVRAAVDGCELVVHAAALFKNWTKDPSAMENTACDGTRNVFQAARDAGVRRVAYTSSSNAVGFTGTLDRPLDETTYNDAPHLPYVVAKVRAERLARELSDEVGVPMVVLLPTGVLGRFDYRITPTTQSFVDVVNRNAPIPFPTNFVDVRDVARCHVLALERGDDGERYIAGGDNASIDDLAEIVESLCGVKPNKGLPPLFVLKAFALVAGVFSSITGKEPAMTREMVAELEQGSGAVFATTKARDKLGLEPASTRDVFAEALRWAGFVGKVRDREVSELVAHRFPADPAWPAV